MWLFNIVRSMNRKRYSMRLSYYKKMGLHVYDDLKLNGPPEWGSEPWLISIGRHVEISSKVSFITHDGGTWVFRDRPGYERVIKFGRIIVHDNCFIGYGAIIMAGVSIGPNAIVAAGSVVTRDIPPNSIASGNPARVIKSLDDYAEDALRRTPTYDLERYRTDWKGELMRLFPPPW